MERAGNASGSTEEMSGARNLRSLDKLHPLGTGDLGSILLDVYKRRGKCPGSSGGKTAIFPGPAKHLDVHGSEDHYAVKGEAKAGQGPNAQFHPIPRSRLNNSLIHKAGKLQRMGTYYS